MFSVFNARFYKTLQFHISMNSKQLRIGAYNIIMSTQFAQKCAAYSSKCRLYSCRFVTFTLCTLQHHLPCPDKLTNVGETR